MTDEHKAYTVLARKYDHRKVNHSAKEYVNGMAHKNGIGCFWYHLNCCIYGIYQFVSKPHLQLYVNEYTLRYNKRLMHTSSRFNLILGNVLVD